MSKHLAFEGLILAIRDAASRRAPFRDAVVGFLRQRGLSASEQEIVLFQRRLRAEFMLQREKQGGRVSTSPETEKDKTANDDDKMEVDTDAIAATLEREVPVPSAKRAKIATVSGDDEPRAALRETQFSDLPPDVLGEIAQVLLQYSESEVVRFKRVSKNTKSGVQHLATRLADSTSFSSTEAWVRILSGDMAVRGNVKDPNQLLKYQLEDTAAAFQILFLDTNDVISWFIDWALRPFIRDNQLDPATPSLHGTFHNGVDVDAQLAANVETALKLVLLATREDRATDQAVLQDALEMAKLCLGFGFLEDSSKAESEQRYAALEFFFTEPRISDTLRRHVGHMLLAEMTNWAYNNVCERIAEWYETLEGNEHDRFAELFEPHEEVYKLHEEEFRKLGFPPEETSTPSDLAKHWYTLSRRIDKIGNPLRSKAGKSYHHLCQTFLDMINNGLHVFRLANDLNPWTRDDGMFFQVAPDVSEQTMLEAIAFPLPLPHQRQEQRILQTKLCIILATPYLAEPGRVFEMSNNQPNDLLMRLPQDQLQMLNATTRQVVTTIGNKMISTSPTCKLIIKYLTTAPK